MASVVTDEQRSPLVYGDELRLHEHLSHVTVEVHAAQGA